MSHQKLNIDTKNSTSKKGRLGYCSICRNYGQLTDEHVPPKSCGNDKDMLVRTISLASEDKKSGRQSQNGLSYRTTCPECNNKWLEKYDRSLANLYNHMLQKLDTDPNSICFTHTIQPQKIARAVIGHLMAANSVSITESFSEHEGNNKLLHDYFFNEEEELPDNIDIYCWYYPSKKIKAIKYVGSSFQLGNPNAQLSGHVLKFFPLAFWVTFDKPKELNIYAPKLIKNKRLPIDENERLTISFHPHPDLMFPEHPHPNGNGFSVYASQIAAEAIIK